MRRFVGWVLTTLGTLTVARAAVEGVDEGRPAPLPTRRKRCQGPDQLFAFIPRDLEFRRRLKATSTEPFSAE